MARGRRLGKTLSGAAVLAALVLAGCGSIERQLSSAFLHPDRNQHAVPSDYGLRYDEVRIDGLRAWFVPSEKSKGETVVLFHGAGSNISHYFAYVRFLNAAGFHVFLHDYPGYGKSDGEALISALFVDLDRILEHVKTRPEVDRARIGLFGISLGSIVALEAASMFPEVCCVVVEDCASPDANIAAYLARERYGWLSRCLMTSFLDTFVLPWGIEPEDNVADVTAPILLMHGVNDRMIDVKTSVRVFAAARQPKTLWLMPETGHAPDSLDAQDGEFQDTVCRFFRAAFDGKPVTVGLDWSCRKDGNGWTVDLTTRTGSQVSVPVQLCFMTDDDRFHFQNRWLSATHTWRFAFDREVKSVSAKRIFHMVKNQATTVWKPVRSRIVRGRVIKKDLEARLLELKFAADPKLEMASALARSIDELAAEEPFHPRLEAELVPVYFELGKRLAASADGDHRRAGLRWLERCVAAAPRYPRAHFWIEGRLRFMGFQHGELVKQARERIEESR